MSDHTTLDRASGERRATSGAPSLAFVALWVDGAPERVGELFRVDGAIRLGRGDGDAEPRAQWVRERPGHIEQTGPLSCPFLSRRQLAIQATSSGRVTVENIGRAGLRVRGLPVAQAVVAPGELVEVEGAVVLRLEERPPLEGPAGLAFPFGGPDDDGLVGESPAMWALRARVAFVARHSGHVLIVGPSGSGKERLAQAVHRRSDRAARPWVARNAATIPASIMDVELFGHVKNYPNPGMQERGGLVGEADGGTLFLDEIGEIEDSLQAHLLRLLDSGEYQRLGDPRSRRADLRFVAATNRPEEALKPDLRARFRHVIRVPGIGSASPTTTTPDRRSDVPLLLANLARLACREDPALAAQFLDGRGHPRLDAALVTAATQAPLLLQVRELEALLWEAIACSRGATIGLPVGTPAAPETPHTDFAEVDRDALVAAIARCDGVHERVWRELGLKNRYVLRRLLKKHGLDAE